MSEPYFVLNRNPDGADVLHKQHGDERCNRDEMKGRETVDPDTAEALEKSGQARYCNHCMEESA